MIPEILINGQTSLTDYPTIGSLFGKDLTMDGVAVELSEFGDTFRFEWRGASRPNTYKPGAKSSELVRDLRYLHGLYDPKSQTFIF